MRVSVKNKGLFFWCLVVLFSDSYIKAALVCGDLRFAFLICSTVIYLCKIKSSTALLFIWEKQKIASWFWQIAKQVAFSEWSFAPDWSPQSPRPARPSLCRPAICFNRPNEARPSTRSWETPPPRWHNHPQKASASASGQATSQPRSVTSSTPGT